MYVYIYICCFLSQSFTRISLGCYKWIYLLLDSIYLLDNSYTRSEATFADLVNHPGENVLLETCVPSRETSPGRFKNTCVYMYVEYTWRRTSATIPRFLFRTKKIRKHPRPTGSWKKAERKVSFVRGRDRRIVGAHVSRALGKNVWNLDRKDVIDMF